MSSIRVANASAFFQERGLDLNGIFRLLCNAVSREFFLKQTLINPCDYPNSIMAWSDRDYMSYAIGVLSKWQENFKGDLDFADKRIKQFYEDYARLHSLNSTVSSLSLWEYLFSRKKEVKQLFAERREIEDMEIEVSELVEIAFYKYVQAKLGTKEDFIREFTELMNFKWGD